VSGPGVNYLLGEFRSNTTITVEFLLEKREKEGKTEKEKLRKKSRKKSRKKRVKK